MNKLIFVLSMALTACTWDVDEPIQEEKDKDALPPGIMQPVEGTGAIAGGSWLPGIQQQRMPINMQ